MAYILFLTFGPGIWTMDWKNMIQAFFWYLKIDQVEKYNELIFCFVGIYLWRCRLSGQKRKYHFADESPVCRYFLYLFLQLVYHLLGRFELRNISFSTIITH